ELIGGGLLAHIGRVGRHFETTLRAIAAKRPALVKDVRGAGLMWGLELTRDAAPVVPAALARGVIVNRTAETVVRLLPPLVITVEEVDEALSRLDAALGTVSGVTTPLGFKAAGVSVGIKRTAGQLDLALLVSDTPATAAAVFTTSRAPAAPILVSRDHLERS